MRSDSGDPDERSKRRTGSSATPGVTRYRVRADVAGMHVLGCRNILSAWRRV